MHYPNAFCIKLTLLLMQNDDKRANMRITVDIDEKTLAEVMAMTGEKRKSPALARAIMEFTHRWKAREFGRLMREGAFDYPAGTGDETDPANPVPFLLKD